MTSQQTVNLICSAASLLSGDLDECYSPYDPTCKGGIASVMAYARSLTEGQPTTVVQKFDKNSPFVNTHPLQWVVNRLILHHIFGLELFFSTPSLLLQNKIDAEGVSIRDITDLQSQDFPFLIANTEVSPKNSWHPYVKTVHFDSQTGLALIAIADTGVPLSINQSDAAKGVLNFIETINQRNGCSSSTSDGIGLLPLYQQYLIENGDIIQSVPTTSTTTTIPTNGTMPEEDGSNQQQEQDQHCWVPVILFDSVEEAYAEFLQEVTSHTNPPALIINIDDSYETFLVPQKYQQTNVWVGHCPMDDENYCQHRITLSSGTSMSNSESSKQRPEILGVDFINRNLEELPMQLKDDGWNTTIRELRKLADQALDNNPTVGYSGAMPVTREGSYRGCQAGECPLGSLFTEALRWFTDSDVAFTSSGGYRGPGWPAGPVTLTDLYAGLPFPNSECTGVMSGLSLFKLLNYTTSVATFEGEDTSEGDRLLQVAGMLVSYNTRLTESRLVGVDVWNRETNSYEPIQRLKLYKFASDSYVCGAYDPYPELTGGNFVMEGEVPGVTGENLVQNIVADYLGQLSNPWDTSFQGRLQNHTRNFDVLNLIQDKDSCGPNTAWDEETMTCIECPSFEFVVFSDELLQFDVDNDIDVINDGRVILVNREPTAVAVNLKSKPSWVEFTSASKNFGVINTVDFLPIPLESGESLVLEFDVVASSLGSIGGARSALGSVSFGVQDGGQYPGCTGRDAIFDVELSVTPPTEYNHLGTIFYVGVALVSVVFVTCVAATSWVYMFRTTRVVKVMQPVFLLTILMGVFILSSTMIPLGIDDGLASERGCDIACMSIPWLLSTGFTISFSALFSKLWRINRLFNATRGIRRVVVTHKDVLAPFVGLFTLNFGILLAWTIADPLRWERFTVGDEEWNTYGTCVGGTVSIILVSCLAAINVGALLLMCTQAYLARNISDDFSESKYIGIAIYGWLQVLVVGVPILFLIDADNPTARYILVVTLIFIVSMSMILIIFVPAYFNFKRMRNHPREHMTETRISGMTAVGNVSGIKPSAAKASSSSRGMTTRIDHTGVPRNVPLAVMDSIDERTPSTFEGSSGGSQANRVSADAETKLLDSAAQNRKRMIEQQINLKESSMAEKINNMMLAMQSDSSSDDSSTSSEKYSG